ncbi:MAG: PQQ-like beta-propeller repeat protein [Verrucomicrobia bacterium]|nr:PQQ-like beta-propeller repeat protein [Verrucomicrobiota bacterium]
MQKRARATDPTPRPAGSRAALQPAPQRFPVRAEAPHYLKAAWSGVLGFLFSSVLGAVSASDEWPEFRGPTGQGHSPATGLPLEWSTKKNIAWKTVVPGTGWSSPVVGRGQIILTTGVPAAGGGVSLRALAFDAATGRAAWDTEVFTAAEAAPQPIHAKNSPASPTPILDGDRVYVHFGHHGTAALDRAGKILWRNRALGYDPVHGNGGSPALAGDRLIFNADGAAAPFVAALDTRTGELRWKVPRTVQPKQTFSFATPLVIRVEGRPQVISPGSGAVAALDPADGRELWHVRYGGGYSVVPRPVFAHGLLFIGTGYNRADLLAIRAGGTGDVTDTHVAWRTTKGAPLTPSLLALGDELYGVDDKGVATCWDARTGKVHWQERIDGNYSASPVAADGRLYFQNETGTGTVLRAGRTFEKLAVNKLEERSLASYAIADGAIFLRTAGHLYRIQRQP